MHFGSTLIYIYMYITIDSDTFAPGAHGRIHTYTHTIIHTYIYIYKYAYMY